MKERERINEAISSWFEPKPPFSLSQDGEWGKVSSGGGLWTLPAQADRKAQWRPLDYFTDESANARLLDAMPLPTLYRFMGNKNWVINPTGHAGHQHIDVEHADRKTAIVLAFCKFAGIEVEP